MLQTPAEYEGTTFTLLIDFGSTHLFISPRCIRNLNLHEHPDIPLTVELATGKRTHTITSVGSIDFKFGEAQTRENFRVLNLGVYDGILGMDWLQDNKTALKCRDGVLIFLDNQGQKSKVMGTHGESKLQLVTATKLLKGLRKNQMIYAVKLNPTGKKQDTQEPDWLLEYADVFLEEVTNLPLVHEVDHAIELVPGAQPILLRDRTRCLCLNL